MYRDSYMCENINSFQRVSCHITGYTSDATLRKLNKSMRIDHRSNDKKHGCIHPFTKQILLSTTSQSLMSLLVGGTVGGHPLFSLLVYGRIELQPQVSVTQLIRSVM